MTESTLHRWDPLKETEWNALLRATTSIKINGYSVLTLSVSVDVNYYRDVERIWDFGLDKWGLAKSLEMSVRVKLLKCHKFYQSFRP